MKETQRLVCHTCRAKAPPGAVGKFCECKWPNVHIHDTTKPCEWCKDD